MTTMEARLQNADGILFYTYCTYITTLCIACPLAHIFHCLNFSYTFFATAHANVIFIGCTKPCAAKMDIRFYLLISSLLVRLIIRSYCFFFSSYYPAERCIDTDSSGEKIIYGCIWFTSSINSSVQLHFHTHCVQLMHFQFFSASVPFGECFRSSHFFSLVGSDFFDNYFWLNVIEIGAQQKFNSLEQRARAQTESSTSILMVNYLVCHSGKSRNECMLSMFCTCFGRIFFSLVRSFSFLYSSIQFFARMFPHTHTFYSSSAKRINITYTPSSSSSSGSSIRYNLWFKTRCYSSQKH